MLKRVIKEKIKSKPADLCIFFIAVFLSLMHVSAMVHDSLRGSPITSLQASDALSLAGARARSFSLSLPLAGGGARALSLSLSLALSLRPPPPPPHVSPYFLLAGCCRESRVPPRMKSVTVPSAQHVAHVSA